MKNFDRIKKYLHDEMSEAERLSFEDELSVDQSLAEEVKIQSFEEDAFEWMLKDELHQKIQHHRNNNAFHKQDSPTPVVQLKRRRNFWILGIAASFLLLLALFLFNQENPTDRLADRLIQDYPPEAGLNLVLKNTEATDSSPNTAYKEGHNYFLQKDYPKAIEAFREYLDTTPESFRARQDVAYYLFLSFLKNGDIEAARSLGQKISSDTTHRFQPALQEILEDL